MAIFDFIFSAFIGILAGLGVGSGGLLVIWLTVLDGVGQLSAQGINLIFFVLASASSLIFHLKSRKILYKTVFFMAIAGVAGTLIGTHFTKFIHPDVLRKIFALMLIFAGCVALIRGLSAKKTSQSNNKKNNENNIEKN